MVAERVNTLVEWAERMHLANPATQDDVSCLVDGRQLDSKDAVEEWLREVEALRTIEVSTRDAVQ
jgi:hypothetical protein